MRVSLNILTSKEKKFVVNQLSSQFGLSDKTFLNDFMILKNNKHRLFLTTSNEKDKKFRIPRLEKAGMYFATINKDSTIRLSLEGTQLIGQTATEYILKLDPKQAENWLKGFDFDFEKVEDGYYLLKYNEDFLGCGLIRNNKMFNFLPKTRRLKNFYD